MIDQSIIERINILEPSYASFIKSDFTKLASQKFGAGANLDENQSVILGNGITLYLLLFLSSDEFIAFIAKECEVNILDATSLCMAIKESLPEGLADAQAQAHALLNEDTTTLDQEELMTNLEEAEKALNNNVSFDIAETEAALKSIPEIPHIRTMSKDMEHTQAQSHVPTYTSTQSAILNEGRNKPAANASTEVPRPNQ